MTTAAAPVWRESSFVKLWVAQTISLVGSQISFLALPLTAILVLDATATEMGILTALGAVPAILAGLHAGALIDRRRRRPLLISTDVGRAALLALVPLAWAADLLSVGLLYAVTLAVGLLGLVFDVAYQAFLPVVVPRDRLVEGNGKLALSSTAAEIAGPGLAGGLVGALAAPVAVALDALSFLGSALLIARIQVKEAVPPRPLSAPRLPAEIADGLRVVFGDPRLRAVAGGRSLLAFFNAMLEAVFVLYLTRSLGFGPALIGVAFAFGSIGFLAGSLFPNRLADRLGFGRTTILALLLVGAGDLLIPVATGFPAVAVPVLVAAQVVFGFGLTVFNVNQVSLRQAIVPSHLQGRAAATVRVLAAGPVPVGALLGGALGQALGLRETLLLAATGELLAALWLWRSPLRFVHTLPLARDVS